MLLKQKNIPNHVAIIMDGNGRWANKKGLPRHKGHEEGLLVLSKIINVIYKAEIRHLTVFAFSSENWKRPREEVKSLLTLFENALVKNFQFLIDKKIKFKMLGSLSRFPKSLLLKVKELENKTKNFKRFNFYLAAGYGSKDEIVNAANALSKEGKTITEKSLRNAFFIPKLPDVDLMIRTGGEKRLSNFLLWQSAYAELYFLDALWPDFKTRHFQAALNFYSSKERKFGKVSKN